MKLLGESYDKTQVPECNGSNLSPNWAQFDPVIVIARPLDPDEVKKTIKV